MNLKIEVIKSDIYTKDRFEKYRHEIKQFAETHKIVNVSTAVSSTGNGASQMFATILYEDT